MIGSIIARVRGFMVRPQESFRQWKDDGAQELFTYFFALLLVNAVLTAIIAAIGMAAMPAYFGTQPVPFFPVVVFFMMLVGGAIVTLLFAAWLHLWVHILGGRNGIAKTANVVIYGSTPRQLLGWIPLIGIIFSLWSLVLCVIGLCELQELSTQRTVLAVLIAILIPLIAIILLAAYFYVSPMSVTAVPVSPV